MPRAMQPSFAAGELAPALHARVDLAKYQVGLRTCRNFFIKPQGGACNRPGTRMLQESINSDPARLIGFQFSGSQGYALEWSHLALRMYVDGGPLLLPGTALSVLNGDFLLGTTKPTSWIDQSTGTASVDLTSGGRAIASGDGTVIGNMTAPATPAPSNPATLTAYRYHRLLISGGSSDHEIVVAQVIFFSGDEGNTPIFGGTGTLLAQTGWTLPASAFDGVTLKQNFESAQFRGSSAWIGKDWLVARTVTAFEVWSSTNQGFKLLSDPTMTFVLQGSTNNTFSAPVTLLTVTAKDTATQHRVRSTTLQPPATTSGSSTTHQQTAYIGKHWTGTRTVSGFALFGGRQTGLKTGPPQTIHVALQGSSDNFVASAVTLWSGDVRTAAAQGLSPGQVLRVFDGVDVSTAYAYHRIRLTGGRPTDDFVVSQLIFYETVGGAAGRVAFTGASASVAWLRQSFGVPTNEQDQTHVLVFRVLGSQGERLQLRVGTTTTGAEVLADVDCTPGWHAIEFIPRTSPVAVQFRNPDATTVELDSVRFMGDGQPGTNLPFNMPTQYPIGDVDDLNYDQSADVMVLATKAHPPRELRRLGAYSWQIVDIPFQPTIAAPLSPAAVKNGTHSGGATTRTYGVTAEIDDGSEESLRSTFATVTNTLATLDVDNSVTITWAASAGAARYNVYFLRNGLFGFIGTTELLLFKDDGIAPHLDDTPPKARNPFLGTGNWPGACGYHDQRLAFGGTQAEPDGVDLSKIAAFHNFSRSSPTKDDDAIEFRIPSRQVNEVRHIIGLETLLLLTSGGEFHVPRGSKGLTPSLEGGIKRISYRGCAKVRPVTIGTSVLYVVEKGSVVRDMVWDGVGETYQSTDLSILSQHLLDGHSIIDWAYQQHPAQIVWVLRDDGAMLSLSYLREHDVVAWARHDTDGFFESACVVNDSDHDAVYFVVRRNIGGIDRRFIELMAARQIVDVRDAYHVDCGLSYDAPTPIDDIVAQDDGTLVVTATEFAPVDGWIVEVSDTTGSLELNGQKYQATLSSGDSFTLANRYTGAPLQASEVGAYADGGVVRRCVTSFSGLDHLEGETVAILADGGVVAPQVVTDGTITMRQPAARVHAGLPFVSDLQTLAIPLPPELYGRRKNVKEVQVFVDQTRGITAGPSADKLTDFKQRTDEPWGQPTRPYTGLAPITVSGDWQASGSIFIRQDQPLPIEVLAVLPAFETGTD